MVSSASEKPVSASEDTAGEMLPCPFCGSPARMKSYYPGAWDHDEERHSVECTKCQAEVGHFGYAEGYEKAREAWDSRVLTPTQWQLVNTIMTAVHELMHAHSRGPNWYTGGESRMWSHIRMWNRKAIEAFDALKTVAPAVSSEPLDNSNVADEK